MKQSVNSIRNDLGLFTGVCSLQLVYLNSDHSVLAKRFNLSNHLSKTTFNIQLSELTMKV